MWNQMTALRFKTRGRQQTSPASLRRQTTGRQKADNRKAKGRQQEGKRQTTGRKKADNRQEEALLAGKAKYAHLFTIFLSPDIE